MIPRPRLIALVSLGCLYSMVFLKGQTAMHELVKFPESFSHILEQAGVQKAPPSSPSMFDDFEEVYEHVDPPNPPSTFDTFDQSHKQTTPTSSSSTIDASEQAHLPHLQLLCSETEWIPNFWLRCHSGCGPNQTSACGGLNNARNRIQTCLRWAIEAGAGLILPSVTMRGDDLVDINGGVQCLDAWWDLQTLQDSMAANCPQLQLRAACDGLNHTDAMVPLGELPDSATIIKLPQRGSRDHRWSKGTFRQQVALPALQSAAASAAASAATETAAVVAPAPIPISKNEKDDNITIFDYGDSMFGWDYRVSGEMATIRKELHFALPYNARPLELGGTIARSPLLHGGAFIGAHLRGESDWPPGPGQGNASEQMVLYEAEMLRIRDATPEGAGVSAVYVSSGDQAAIQEFRERLEPLGFTVHDKWTILQSKPEVLALVDDMDFDSKGIIDFEVLVRAQFFMGVSLFVSDILFASLFPFDIS